MSVVTRQQTLFAAEDWKVVYKAYSEINFQAYDFDTIRAALVEYVKTNYPENFNDYIESSEFIAIIELLAYLSQSIAFRMDINTRENFLETAERRDSVFKLARMLGYNPKRNYPASGLVKLVSVRTSENITDSQNNTLNNREIFWDDANNPLSYEQFISVLNASMSRVNRFTSPIKSGTFNAITTELYQLNTPLGSPISYNFKSVANGVDRPFNIVNPDFTPSGSIYERSPDPSNLFNLIYRNDSKGLNSKDTGFFMMFKQGTLNFQDYDFTSPVSNRTQDLDVINVNEDDVYLQEISTTGTVKSQWSRVPNLVGQTLNYNELGLETRDIFGVQNKNNSGISLVFSDGNFGNVPNGIYRLWYRVSDGTRYIIQPEEMRERSITVPYQNANGQDHTITIKFSLQQSVNNSLPAESLVTIKQNAPQVYYTQNRMVNNADYNTLPMALNSSIRKLKAINRTHAGHSRYIDLNDPTGVYNDVDTFAMDGFLYAEDSSQTIRVLVNDNTTPLDIATSTVPGLLKSQRLNNFVYYGMRNGYQKYKNNYFDLTATTKGIPTNFAWNPLPVELKSQTGYITETFSQPSTLSIMTNDLEDTKRFQENNFIKWVNPDNAGEYVWSRIVKVTNNGALVSGLATSTGSWTLSTEVPQGWLATDCVTSIRKIFTESEATTIRDAISDRRTFGLGYDAKLDSWYIMSSEINISDSWKPKEQNLSQSWLLIFTYAPLDNFSYLYNISSRGQDYVIQSEQELKFFNINAVSSVDSDGKSNRDQVIITTLNTKPGIEEVQKWTLRGDTSTNGKWVNQVTGYAADPEGYRTNIPMPSRDIIWTNVNAQWISNFGLFDSSLAGTGSPESKIDKVVNGTGSVTDSHNFYVSDATVGLNTYFDDNTSRSATSNITIASKSGMVSALPSTIGIPFNASTFGASNKILDDDGNITYRQFDDDGIELLIFHGGVDGVFSYGPNGTVFDANARGRIQVIESNPADQSGTLTYSKLNYNVYHSSIDVTGMRSEDKLSLTYDISSSQLDESLVWNIHDTYEYADGYIDPSKVSVSPVDTDGDMVPDRPLQFSEYVGDQDVLLFEYYTDFDGYTYDKPVAGVVWDLRFQGGIVSTMYENAIEYQYLDGTGGQSIEFEQGHAIHNTDDDRYFVAERTFNTGTHDVYYYLSLNWVTQLPRPIIDNSGVTYNPGSDTLTPSSFSDPRPVADLDFVMVRDYNVISQDMENLGGYMAGLHVYTEFSCTQGNVVYPAGTVYTLTPQSTNLDIITAEVDENYFSRRGRGKTQDTSTADPEKCVVRWNHVAPNNVRIDPSISNVIENVVLTDTYYNRVQSWLANPSNTFPVPPTSAQLSQNFQSLNLYKSASDTLTFRSAEFLKLFGDTSDTKYQAKFKLVKLTNNLSDNELKSKVITAINAYFNIDNWQYGETFYFTEMASFIHQQLGSNIGSIVIVPKNTAGVFGQGFQVKAQPNQLFVSTATVDDIEIISQIDAQTLSPLR